MKERQEERERLYRLARGFEGSGETRAEYSRRVGLAPAMLDYYRRRAREQPAKGARWVEVEPAPSALRPGSEMVLVLGDGVRVELGGGFDAEALARLLQVLERMR